MLLLVRVVNEMVLLWLFVLPGVVVDDAPVDDDARWAVMRMVRVL